MKASEGIAKIDAAVKRGRDAIDVAVSMFSGTVPPRPWPSPELYKAIDDAEDARDKLDVFVRKGDPDFDPSYPYVKRTVEEVNRRIKAIDDARTALQGRAELVRTQTPTQALVKAASDSPRLKKLITFGGIAYLLWKAEKRGGRR